MSRPCAHWIAASACSSFVCLLRPAPLRASPLHAGSLQHLGRNAGIAPGSVADTTIFTELPGNLDERRLQRLDIGGTCRIETCNAGPKIAHFLRRKYLVDARGGLQA